MKRIDIEKELKNEATKFAPDTLDKIKAVARAENLLPRDAEGNSEVYSQGNTAAVAKSKRKIVWLVSVFSAVILCLALILSFALNFGKNKPIGPTRLSLSIEDVYGIGSVSSAKLLGSGLPVNAIRSFAGVNAAYHAKTKYANTDASEDEVKRQAERFNDYFTALDSFLGDDIVSTVIEKNTDSRYSYDTKMTITGKDLNGNSISYVMYYTETLLQDDFNDEEREYGFVGVIVIDGADYYLEGERSEENEEDESETELRIRVYADKQDRTSYIQMEQEYSVENGETEKEYVYSVYAGGILLEQTAVEFEEENRGGKVETEYELEFISGASKGRYIVERETVGNNAEIKVEYTIDGKSGEFRIREIVDDKGDRQYEYTFSDNEKIVF